MLLADRPWARGLIARGYRLPAYVFLIVTSAAER
jgi:hypothetical protein